MADRERMMQVAPGVWARVPSTKAATKKRFAPGAFQSEYNIPPAPSMYGPSAKLPVEDILDIISSPEFEAEPWRYTSALAGYMTPGELEAFRPPPPTGTGGYYRGPTGGGGAPGLPPVTYTEAPINIAGAPLWWRALMPSTFTPQSEFMSLANLMIPFLSPEDQRNVATSLYQIDPETFSHLDPTMLNIFAPTTMTQDLQTRFTSAARAESALGALGEFAGVAGKSLEDLGPGAMFLRNLADIARDFGARGTERMTRTQRRQMSAALDPLLAQAKAPELAAFGPLAKAFAQPFFSAGPIIAPPSPGLF